MLIQWLLSIAHRCQKYSREIHRRGALKLVDCKVLRMLRELELFSNSRRGLEKKIKNLIKLNSWKFKAIKLLILIPFDKMVIKS